ncbi:unnamed protein product [Ectocarpus fasciculatus]
MLDSEEDSSHRSTRTSRRGRGGRSGHLMLQNERRGLFDYDDEPPLPHLHLDPRVSAELEDVYAEVQADGWQPWREEEKLDGSESGLSSSRLSDGRLGCSCKKCHTSSELSLGTEEEAEEGTCWNDVLAEYECDICFDVLVGVHVLDNCGHTFCGACMERWIDNAPQGECPVCRTPVDKLVPVRKMDEMIAKAVDAAAPSRERDAWYERRAHWEGTARRRQEARAAAAASAPLHSVVHAQGAAAGVFRRTGLASWFGGTADARQEGGGRSNRGRREEEDRGRGDEDEDDDGLLRLDKMQTVLAVAVMLVMAVIKIRGLR